MDESAPFRRSHPRSSPSLGRAPVSYQTRKTFFYQGFADFELPANFVAEEALFSPPGRMDQENAGSPGPKKGPGGLPSEHVGPEPDVARPAGGIGRAPARAVAHMIPWVTERGIRARFEGPFRRSVSEVRFEGPFRRKEIGEITGAPGRGEAPRSLSSPARHFHRCLGQPADGTGKNKSNP